VSFSNIYSAIQCELNARIVSVQWEDGVGTIQAVQVC